MGDWRGYGSGMGLGKRWGMKLGEGGDRRLCWECIHVTYATYMYMCRCVKVLTCACNFQIVYVDISIKVYSHNVHVFEKRLATIMFELNTCNHP